MRMPSAAWSSRFTSARVMGLLLTVMSTSSGARTFVPTEAPGSARSGAMQLCINWQGLMPCTTMIRASVTAPSVRPCLSLAFR
jgi:hypothetical protein